MRVFRPISLRGSPAAPIPGRPFDLAPPLSTPTNRVPPLSEAGPEAAHGRQYRRVAPIRVRGGLPALEGGGVLKPPRARGHPSMPASASPAGRQPPAALDRSRRRTCAHLEARRSAFERDEAECACDQDKRPINRLHRAGGSLCPARSRWLPARWRHCTRHGTKPSGTILLPPPPITDSFERSSWMKRPI